MWVSVPAGICGVGGTSAGTPVREGPLDSGAHITGGPPIGQLPVFIFICQIGFPWGLNEVAHVAHVTRHLTLEVSSELAQGFVPALLSENSRQNMGVFSSSAGGSRARPQGEATTCWAVRETPIRHVVILSVTPWSSPLLCVGKLTRWLMVRSGDRPKVTHCVVRWQLYWDEMHSSEDFYYLQSSAAPSVG